MQYYDFASFSSYNKYYPNEIFLLTVFANVSNDTKDHIQEKLEIEIRTFFCYGKFYNIANDCMLLVVIFEKSLVLTSACFMKS